MAQHTNSNDWNVDSLSKHLKIAIRGLELKESEDKRKKFWNQLIEEDIPFIQLPTDSSRIKKKMKEQPSHFVYFCALREIPSDLLFPVENEDEMKREALNRTEELEGSVFEEDGGFRMMPRKPYHRDISNVLFLWNSNGTLPFQFKEMKGLNQTEDYTKVISPLLVDLKSIQSQWNSTDEEGRIQSLILFLKRLDLKGIMTLLRIRQTAGSVEVLPPGTKQMVASMRKQHTEGSEHILSVAARALSKHFLRSQTDKFWGENMGKEEEKNRKAEEVITSMMKRVCWVNIHQIVHGVIIFEVRTEEGYGARWLGDGSEFRGVIEPQMEDGHNVGWCH
eukprot:TRINITY_DN6413_c0_g1_i1.p1 TRINITY_DN6413_c0_g1~~TRINITY_DN6413_c0_g1_i1.p1  ORF type:complete len:335 (+),score=108.61 TRINITY_DN6413_c0_g1_i1:194-1198(+)